MKTLTSSIVRPLSHLMENLFGLSVTSSAPSFISQSDKDYTVSVISGTAFKHTVRQFKVTSSDSPAVLACKLVVENPSLAENEERIWIHDPTLANKHPHRYRAIMVDGQPHARLIDPRRR